jgi:hypothetical protein
MVQLMKTFKFCLLPDAGAKELWAVVVFKMIVVSSYLLSKHQNIPTFNFTCFPAEDATTGHSLKQANSVRTILSRTLTRIHISK